MSSSIPVTIPMAVYFVIPVESSPDGRQTDEHTQVCNYYIQTGDNTFTQVLPPTPQLPIQLQAVASGLALDYILLQQLDPRLDTVLVPKLASSMSNARLFSATSKNLRSLASENALPNVFLAAAATPADLPSVAVPVAPPELRGLILVFTGLDSNGNTLRGTHDPEIKGSTNG